MIKAVVFDLDHTLFDRHGTLRAVTPALRRSFPTNPALTDDEIAALWCYADDRYVYDGWSYILAYLSQNGVFTAPVDYADYRAFVFENFAKTAVPFPFALPMLNVLKDRGLKVGLITNGQHALQYKKLDLTGLRYVFDEIIVSGDVMIDKPDPEIFEMMCEKLGVLPQETVYVGDNPVNDVEGARKAGLRTIWIRSTRVSGLDCHPDEVANDVREIPLLVDQINKTEEETQGNEKKPSAAE